MRRRHSRILTTQEEGWTTPGLGSASVQARREPLPANPTARWGQTRPTRECWDQRLLVAHPKVLSVFVTIELSPPSSFAPSLFSAQRIFGSTRWRIFLNLRFCARHCDFSGRHDPLIPAEISQPQHRAPGWYASCNGKAGATDAARCSAGLSDAGSVGFAM